jgi:ATP-binding cassette subfamily B protein
LILGEGMRYIIDQGFSHHNPAMLDRGLYALIGLIVLFSFASYSRVSLINLICEKIVAKIRLDVYRHITCLSPGFFEVNKTSDMISRLTVDTTLLSSIIGNASSFALRNMIMMVGGIGFLMATSLKLTCYVILTVPIVLIPIMLIGRRLRKLSKIVQEEMVDISAHIEESINASRPFKP